MKIKILKGTNQVGGCITEITSNEAKIIVDLGMDLPDLDIENKKVNPSVKGLTYGAKRYDAVFITHNHIDHIGLISYVLPNVPIYVEKVNKCIYNVLCNFIGVGESNNTLDITDKESITIKDIKITPYVVDHSAYNSLMLLIESGGKRILHTGDFRNHGYKGKSFEKVLEKIDQVDAIITEGTSFSRNSKEVLTEEELSNEATKIMQKYNQVFILQSGTNIDRITSMYKAAKKTNKIFIEDVFVANVTSLTKSSIPNPITFSNVYTYIPQNRYIKEDIDFHNKYIKPFSNKNVVRKMFHNDYAMNIRTNMMNDLIKFKEKGLITNACLIYSMWDGYKEKKEFKQFLDKAREMGIDIIDLHTSGHADINTIKKVVDYLKPSMVIPIHTTNKLKAKELFKNSVILDDNEEVEV